MGEAGQRLLEEGCAGKEGSDGSEVAGPSSPSALGAAEKAEPRSRTNTSAVATRAASLSDNGALFWRHKEKQL